MLMVDAHAAFARCLFNPGLDIPHDVISSTARHPTRRFNVYRNNVILSLVDVLQAYFPVVERLVGEQFFRAMVRTFVIAQPPKSPILSRYGDRFADFIACFEPVSDLPYLADVARLEWLRQRAYHAADARSVSPEVFAEIPPTRVGDVVVCFHPSLSTMRSSVPVVSIWKANVVDGDVAPISLDLGGEDAVVVRPNRSHAVLDVMVLPLAAGAYTFVNALREGQCLQAATTLAMRQAENFNLQHTLGALMTVGAFVGWQIDGTACAPTAGTQER